MTLVAILLGDGAGDAAKNGHDRRASDKSAEKASVGRFQIR